ncbi:MAG: gfo/Idh/MocA family oxidoreductase, partial [Planctomycetota bacterium]|nr:gfo/Idh/MocA family oxidoreductase [Planctomycetota bacterium]
DVARWGLGKDEWPTKIESSGGRYGYSDDGQTPNTQMCTFKYDNCLLQFEVRGLPTNADAGIKIGNIFYGSKGYMTVNGSSWATFLGHKSEPGPSGRENSGDHFGNFIAAVKSRKQEDLHADILECHRSSALCHLGNIAYQTGRALEFDPKAETFGNDQAANALLTRDYRAPFTMPESV